MFMDGNRGHKACFGIFVDDDDDYKSLNYYKQVQAIDTHTLSVVPQMWHAHFCGFRTELLGATVNAVTWRQLSIPAVLNKKKTSWKCLQNSKQYHHYITNQISILLCPTPLWNLNNIKAFRTTSAKIRYFSSYVSISDCCWHLKHQRFLPCQL